MLRVKRTLTQYRQRPDEVNLMSPAGTEHGGNVWSFGEAASQPKDDSVMDSRLFLHRDIVENLFAFLSRRKVVTSEALAAHCHTIHYCIVG